MPAREPKVMVWLALATVKVLLAALVRPLALAVNCLFVPAESTRKSLKLTMPLPAVVPMSSVVVPSSGPVPALSVTVAGWLPARPTVELLPNWSLLRRTGWVTSIEPTVPLAGCVAKASCEAAAGLTAMAVEVVLVKLPLVKLMVMLVATLCARLVKVANPFTAVAVSVPCNVPLPALRVAVTTVLLSAVNK